MFDQKEWLHGGSTQMRCKQKSGNSAKDNCGGFRISNAQRCTDHNGGGRSNIPQVEADYPVVAIGKKIDGSKTRGRDLRDEEEGFRKQHILFAASVYITMGSAS